MATNNIKHLHDEHKKWRKLIEQWNQGITKLQRLLKDFQSKGNSDQVQSKIEKYANHLEHNKRFLKEMLEIVESHELFLNEFEDIDIPDPDIDMDHDKTQQHIKEFETRYVKLETKILKLIQKDQ